MSLRIKAENSSAPPGPDMASASASQPADQYLDRLVKLVPAESIAAYPVLAALADDVGFWAQVLVSWVLLLVAAVLRWQVTREPDKDPQYAAIMIACVSFVIWVSMMGGHFGGIWLLNVLGLESLASTFGNAKQFLTMTAMVVWTILVPVFYKGD